MDALICRVFPSSLGDLRLEWFDKFSHGVNRKLSSTDRVIHSSIRDQHKAPKGIGSLLKLIKGKNETIRNYSNRHWETYNEIKECSEELAMASYTLELTPMETLGKLNAQPSTQPLEPCFPS